MQDQMRDSGDRERFATGAVRDAASNKPRPDLVSPFAMLRLGKWLALGAKKYHERNWEQGMPISRCVASLCRHLELYKAGDKGEDHMAAVMCNAMFIMHLEEMVRSGGLRPGLKDMPDYGDAIQRFIDTEQDDGRRETFADTAQRASDITHEGGSATAADAP